MKVKLLVARTDGTARGDVIDVSDAEAKRMIEATPPQAVPFAAEKPVEKRKPAKKKG